MNRFYFNTGVKPSNVSNFPYEYHSEIGNVIRGTLLIPFDCDVPKDSKLMFLCDSNDACLESENVVVTEVFNSNMNSKYAYFKKL